MGKHGELRPHIDPKFAKKATAFDVWFAFYGKEIGIHQLRARLKDLGWTDEEIEEGLDDNENTVM